MMRTGRARIGYQDQVTREEAEKKQTRKMKMKTETERRKGDTYLCVDETFAFREWVD